MLTEPILRQLWPHGDSHVPGLIAGIVAAQPRVYAKYGFRSDVEVAQAFANFSHECGAGLEMIENRNYSADRASEVWPLRRTGSPDPAAFRHFADAADCYAKCKSWAGDPDFHRKLLNLVYGTRMGNRPGTDDGYNLVGRGLPQTTGHDGYVILGGKMGLDLLANPDLIIRPEYALEAGIADFVACGCLPYAKQDSLVGSASCLNLGHFDSNPAHILGYSERAAWLNKFKAGLAGSPPITISTVPAPAPKVVSKKNVAAATIVVAGGAAAKQAHASGVHWLYVVAIAAAAAAVAALAWYVLHKRSESKP